MFTELAVALDAPAQFIVPGTLERTMDPLVFVLNTKPTLRVRFYRNGLLVGLPVDVSISLFLYRADIWNPDGYLARAAGEDWTEVNYGYGTSYDVYYDGVFDLEGDVINAFFRESRQSSRDGKGILMLESTEFGKIIIEANSVIFFGQPTS